MKKNKKNKPQSKPELKDLISKTLEENHIPLTFPKEVLKEASLTPLKIYKKDHKNRTDLTKLAFCTIDGETAKDFDDAVFAKKAGEYIEVYVAIADVSHYVSKNSHLDKEAYLRSTSIYYPGSVIPMLPERLSNDICSLKPMVFRLTMSVKFLVNKNGAISQPKIEQSIIKSQARLTYTEVESFFDHPKNNKSISKDIKESLSLIKKAALLLRKARIKRGAIDFDITESLVTLDKEGEPLSVHPEWRLEAHRVIEDLMVAANEVVAQYFFKKNIPTIYRIHEAPSEEKLDKVTQALKSFGLLKRKPKKLDEPKNLQALMQGFENSKYKETLNTLTLRSMMQAKYSEKNLGHFGLASKAYLHFTSPIRRYADLVVHHQLKAQLFKEKNTSLLLKDDLMKIANFISENEARAVDIERKIDKFYATSFMSKKIGEKFLGTISACTEFGFFVKLHEHHIEGLVHISSISKSFVSYIPEQMCLVIEGQKKRFLIGDEVKVQVKNANIARGFIDFVLVNEYKRKHSKKITHHT